MRFVKNGKENKIYTLKHLVKSTFWAIALNIFLSYGEWSGDDTIMTALSLTCIFIYGFFSLAKDIPYGYDNGILDFLKFVFLIMSFFTTIEFTKGHIMSSFLTISFICVLSFIVYLRYRKNIEDSKSNHLEIIVLCIEHMLNLGFVSAIDKNPINRVFMMILLEQLVFTHLHVVVIYCIKKVCKEDTDGFILNKKCELLSRSL